MTLYDLLKRDEGVVDHVYYLNGIPHCGVGHNLVTGPRLTPAAMDLILRDDVAVFASQMAEAVTGWAALNDARQAVLISVAYQCGMAGFLGFEKMLHAVAQRDYHTAAMELRNSQLARQNVARTAQLAVMLETGRWPLALEERT